MRLRRDAIWVGVRNRTTGEQMTVRGYHLVDALRLRFPAEGQGDPVEHAALMSALNDLAENLRVAGTVARIAADLNIACVVGLGAPLFDVSVNDVAATGCTPRSRPGSGRPSTGWNAGDTWTTPHGPGTPGRPTRSPPGWPTATRTWNVMTARTWAATSASSRGGTST